MRQCIIQAAIEIMVKCSMAEFSLTDVAEKLGLTKAAIYWYFPNKNALMVQAAQSIYNTYIGYIEKISSSDLSSYEKLRRIVLGEDDTIQAALMCLFPIKFFLEYYSENHVVKNLIQNGYERYNCLITALLEEGIRSKEFRCDLPPRSWLSLSQAPSTDWHSRTCWSHLKNRGIQNHYIFRTGPYLKTRPPIIRKRGT